MFERIKNLFLPSRELISSTSSATAYGKHYAAGAVTSKDCEWTPDLISGDSAISQSWPTLTARIRHMAANDSVFQKALSQLVTMVVGGGINTYSSATLPDGTEGKDEEAWNYENDTWFERWAEEEADADGEKTLAEMQRLMFQETAEVGNCLMLRVIKSDKNRISPLCYRMIEWEQLAHDYTTPAIAVRNLTDGHRIQNGIEYDKNNRKVAYWIYVDHPYDETQRIMIEPTRFPAERIIHSFLPSRVSSSVGVSWFAALIGTSRDRDRLIGNTLTSSGLHALQTLVWKSDDHAPTSLASTDAETGVHNVRLGKPFISKVGKNDDVVTVEAKKGLFELQSFLQHITMMEAMGARMSLHRLTGDAGRANLAAIKAGNEDDDAMVSPIRGNQAKHALRIRRDWTDLAVATGRLRTVSPKLYRDNKWRYRQYEVIAARRGDLNAKDDLEAAIDALRSGLSTFQLECARRGLYWRRILRQIKQINEATARDGIALDWTKGNGGDNVATTTDAEAQQEAMESNKSEVGQPNAG